MASHVVIRNKTENLCAHFIEFPPTMISCKAIEQCHNQDFDIDIVKVQDSSISTINGF